MYGIEQGGQLVEHPILNLRARFPDVSWPSVIDDTTLPFGLVKLYQSAMPQYNPATQVVEADGYEKLGDDWVQKWTVRSKTPEELYAQAEATQQAISDAVQARLDDFAKTRGYDNIVSACSYATSTHAKYGPEGRYCVAAREATWDVVFAIRDAVLAGTRQMPTSYADIESELPVLVWP